MGGCGGLCGVRDEGRKKHLAFSSAYHVSLRGGKKKLPPSSQIDLIKKCQHS